jgi:zinc transporter ZupT
VNRWFHYLLAYGTGFALALALGELIPSGLEAGRENAVWALAGFCLAYLVDKLLESNNDEGVAERGLLSGTGLTIVGVSVCSFFDGVAVAAAAGAGESGNPVGWLLLLGLIPHKFIEGSDVTLLMLSATMARRFIWLLIGGVSIATLLGGIAVELTVPPALEASAQAFAGGLLLHLVASERIPGFSGPLEKIQASLVVAGVVTFVLTRVVLVAAGVNR